MHERNYPTHDLMFVIVVFSFKIWRHYLYSVHVCVYRQQKTSIVFTQKELNLRQRMLFEMLKDYDMSVLYHPGKANVVEDARNHMTMGSMS